MADKKKAAPASKPEKPAAPQPEMISVKLPLDIVAIARKLSGHMDMTIAELIAAASREKLQQWQREEADRWQSEVKGK